MKRLESSKIDQWLRGIGLCGIVAGLGLIGMWYGPALAANQGRYVEARWNATSKSFEAQIGNGRLKVMFTDVVRDKTMSMIMKVTRLGNTTSPGWEHTFGYRVVENIYYWIPAKSQEEYLVVNMAFGAHAGGVYIFALKRASDHLLKQIESPQPILLEWGPDSNKLIITHTVLQTSDQDAKEVETQTEFSP